MRRTVAIWGLRLRIAALKVAMCAVRAVGDILSDDDDTADYERRKRQN